MKGKVFKMSKKTKKVNKEINKEVKVMTKEAENIKNEVDNEAQEQAAPAQEETMIHIVGPFYRTKKVKAEEEEKESVLKKIAKPVGFIGIGIGAGLGIAKAIAGIEDDGEEVNDTEE